MQHFPDVFALVFQQAFSWTGVEKIFFGQCRVSTFTAGFGGSRYLAE